MTPPLDAYRLVFDGGSRGNPGPGYGSFRLSREGEAWSEPTRLEFGRRVTNNEAEYRALIGGLEALAELVDDPSQVALDVFSDSQLVVRQMKGEWQVRALNLRPLNHAARNAAARFGRVRYKWHSRRESVRLLGH